MKAGLAVVALALSFVMVSPALASADVNDPGKTWFTSKILNGFYTPTGSPGSSLTFAFNLTNPYENGTEAIEDVTLTIGVYKYTTQDTSREVDEDFDHAPILDHLGTEVGKEFASIESGDTERIELDVSTRKDTPHGSYFSPGTYFVRFKLSFHFNDNATDVVLQSRGFFTDEQWDEMVSFTGNQSTVNMTYMRSLGIDGLLPDSAFGMKKPIPLWPLGLLIAGIVVVGLASVYYYVMDKPGRYPRLEQRFYYLRGKLRELRSQLKDCRRK